MNNETTNTQASSGWGTMRLRLYFVIPLAIAIVIVSLSLSVILYEHKVSDVQKGVIHTSTSAKNFYDTSIRYDTDAMKAIMHTLEQDKNLHEALAKGDRNVLLHRTAPLFENLKRDFKITHLYFTRIDRVNLLRVHVPSRYGDIIDRITMDQAASSGSLAHGVELGTLGTLTLRLVSPWYDTQTHTLIGYVELGMEIDNVMNKLQDFLGVQIFTFIKKESLDREKWESGMRVLGHASHWDHFPNMVLSKQSMHEIPPLLAEYLSQSNPITDNSILHMPKQNIFYRVSLLPLYDISGDAVGQMILFADISKDVKDAREIVYLGSIIAFVVGTVLILFFYWLVGRIGRHIETDEKRLLELATRDGLTDLYNHRTFYSILENEIVRAHRYKHSVSLLMLDIDHFKEVNDTYGHQTGDMVLSGLSKRLQHRMRSTDWACRYGGEEITVILTETDISMAEKIAEDLRIIIEEEPFDIDNGQSISITVSIGLTSYPVHAQDVPSLVSNADTALYKAKESGRNRVCVYQPEEGCDDRLN